MDNRQRQFVTVAKNFEGAEQIKLPTGPDNKLGLETLNGAFPGAPGLKYKNSANEDTGLRIEGGKIYPPADGWDNKVFVVTGEVVEKDTWEKAIADRWDQWVFLVKGNGMEGSGVLITNRRVLTAAHLSFEVGKEYKIKTFGLNEKAKCIKVDKDMDYAILQSDKLPDKEILEGRFRVGDRFLTMGYPSVVDRDHPAVGTGIIMGYTKNEKELLGTPGSSRGFSGAPVFTKVGRLGGILLGGMGGYNEIYTISEIMLQSGEQKYSRILPVEKIKDLGLVRDDLDDGKYKIVKKNF